MIMLWIVPSCGECGWFRIWERHTFWIQQHM